MEKYMDAQMLEAFRTPKRHDYKRTSSENKIVKMLSVQNKERILKAVREKCQFTHKSKLIKIIFLSRDA
jgi:hypothetical protein